jgi:rhodanese-related sulfurtransferase
MIQYLQDDFLKKEAKNLNNAVIIDIRNPNEHAKEHICNSINIPLEQLKQTDPNQWQDQIVIFHCKSGTRTKNAESIINRFNTRQSYCLSGGIEQWKKCGLKIEVNSAAPLDIMRQVQITIGILILLSVILAYFVSGYFIILTLIAGCGLLLAGITGQCLLAKLLMSLPYNKR